MRIINQVNTLPSTVTANVTTMQIFPSSLNALVAASLGLPGTNRFNRKQFRVRASGYATTATATNVTITLQSGTSLTSGNNTTIKASSARALNTASAPWTLEALLVLDSVSGLLHGGAIFVVNNTIDALAAITAITALVPSAEPVMNFVVGITFSANDPGNIGQITEFCVGF